MSANLGGKGTQLIGSLYTNVVVYKTKHFYNKVLKNFVIEVIITVMK